MSNNSSTSGSAEEIARLKVYVPIACGILALEATLYFRHRHRESLRRRAPAATMLAACAAMAYTCIELFCETKGGANAEPAQRVLQGIAAELTFATVVLPFLFRGWLVLYQSRWEGVKCKFRIGQSGYSRRLAQHHEASVSQSSTGGGRIVFPEALLEELRWFKRHSWTTQTRGYFLLLGPWLLLVACGVLVTMWLDGTLEGEVVHFSSEALALSSALAGVYLAGMLIIAYHIRRMRDEYDIKHESYLALLVFAMYIGTNVARRLDVAGIDLLELSTALAGVTAMTAYPLAESALHHERSNRADRQVRPVEGFSRSKWSFALDALLLSDTYFTSSPQGREMKIVLVDDNLRDAFKKFLGYLWCSENLCFVEEVLAFQTAVDCHASDVEIAERVRNICDNYLVEGSSLEVNVSHKMRQKVLDTVADHRDALAVFGDNPGLFNEAAVEIADMMARNALDKFKHSDMWDSHRAAFVAAGLSEAQ